VQLTSEIAVELIDSMGDDERIVEAMLVRRPTDGKVAERIGFIMRKRHGSPFEHAAMTFRVQAPIKVWREHHRHRVGWCLAGDTRVPCPGLPRGSRSVERLYQLRHQLPIVRAVNASARRFISAYVTDAVRSGVKQLYRVRAGARVVRASADHAFLTCDGWKRVSEFGAGTVLLVSGRAGNRAAAQPCEPAGAEEWRKLPFDDCYEVSSHGRVRTYLGQGAKRLRLVPLLKVVSINTANGEPTVSVRSRRHLVCQLVAAAFLGPVPSGMQLLHEDDDRSNNCASNLYYGTPADNMEDQYRNGGRVRKAVVEAPLLAVERDAAEVTYDLSIACDDHAFVANGFVVHNSYNEESGRYKQLEAKFYVPPRERRSMRRESFRSAEPTFEVPTDEEYSRTLSELERGYGEAYARYEALLALGVDRGLARDVLGVGIFSTCYCTCNPRSLMHFLELRTDRPDAKRPSKPLYEIEAVARQYEAAFAELFPLTHSAWCAHGRMAP
jgi:thymidylate synthase ThyX